MADSNKRPMEWKLGLNFYSSRAMILNPLDLSRDEVQEEIEKNKYHIYIVCKRKMMFYIGTESDGPDFYKTEFYWLNDDHEKIWVGYRHPSVLKINGYKEGMFDIDFRDAKNLPVHDYILVNALGFLEDDLIGNSVARPIHSDLEVVYVGQVFGRNQIRKIDYRIRKHEKVQAVALDILRRGSNEEVLVIGLCVDLNDLATSLITTGNVRASTLPELIALKEKASQRIPEGQALTVFEASLIRYFQPAFNTEYKETFPEAGVVSYAEIYDTQFDYSNLTLDTRPVNVRVYSKAITERKYVHSQHYPLRTRSEKLTLFEFLYEFAEKESG